MAMQIRRTPTPNGAPIIGSLAPGQLNIEMASDPPRLWVGVDAAIDVTGQRLVVGPSIYVTGPATAGNFLRSDTGAWVAGLPLQGGTLATMTTAAGGGVGLTMTNNANTAQAAAITVNNGPTTESTSRGISIVNTGAGVGLRIRNASASNAGMYILNEQAAGRAINIDNWLGTAIEVSNTTSNTGIRLNGSGNQLVVFSTPAGTPVPTPQALVVRRNPNLDDLLVDAWTGLTTLRSLRVGIGATEHFAVAETGAITLSAAARTALRAALESSPGTW